MRFAHLAVLSLSLATVACSNDRDSTFFVTKGDMFFDDAMSRLTPAERQGLERNGPDYIRGFFFIGERKSCIVIFSVRPRLIHEGHDPGFCYDNKTNQFVERL
jgi:hypothetical protein